jgi:phosphatidylinositol alpha-1,6-mannosyltransferase
MTDRLPVLLLTEVFPPRQGGSGRWLFELYRRLPQLDVTVLAGIAPGAETFDTASPLRTIRLHTAFPSWGLLGLGGGRAYASALRQVVRTARSHRAAVLHCGKCLPEGLLAMAARPLAGTAFWCYAHGEELTLSRTSRELRALTRLVLRRAHRVIANSQHTRGLLLDQWGLPADRVVVLTPGVDTNRFRPGPADATIRRRLGWTGRRVILTVGALQKRKGQDMLIRALPRIRRECPDVLYAMAGEGWERDALERLASDLGVRDGVHFVGIAGEDELVELYQQCDLFALPNRAVGWDIEGFGIVLLEAQACGRPVVAGASGGAPETLIPGVTGELVVGDDPAALAETCSALLRDPDRRQRLGEAGRGWVVSRFDWAPLAEQALALFREPAAAPR